MTQEVLVLLLGRPGPLRMALEALLLSVTEVKVVQLASDCTEALEFVRLYHPTLAIVDGGLEGATVSEVLAQIESASPQTPCLVWLENVDQEQLALTAKARVVLEGTTATEIISTIAELLAEPR